MSLVPFDDRDGHIWFDGKMVPWREAKIHFLTHTFHYGSGVFEGIRAYGGHIFKLKEHSLRLLDGCKQLDMPIPYTLDQIMQSCRDTVKANKITNGYIRPLAWRGAEQLSVAATQTKIHFAVASWEWPSYFGAEAREKGIRLCTSRWRRPAPDCAPVHAKASGLYIIGTLSKHEAEKKGFTDCLMLDYRGRVAELTGANFFMVKNGELHTPEADCFLNGITRQTVVQLARDNGFKVTERAIMPEELKTADECFAVGTAAEVTPIGGIDDVVYKVGPVTKTLMDKYTALVNAPPAQKSAA